MQHFAVCTLLMSCQDSARECHRAVCHRAVRVAAGGGDMQVSFPAHLLPALLLTATSPWLLPAPSLPLQQADLTGKVSLSAPGLSRGMEDGVQPFPAMALRFPTTGQRHVEERLVHTVSTGAETDHPNPLWIWVLISAGKKRRKIFSHSLILCHCAQAQNQLKKEIILLPSWQVDIWALQACFC